MQERINCFNEPFTIQWHITDLCNLNCRHCYRIEEKTEPTIDQIFFTLNKCYEFLEKLNVSGRFHLAGGEPLLSPFLYDIINFISSRKSLIRLLTNGLLIDKVSAKELYKSGLRFAQISIEGCEESNNNIRGFDSYRQTIEGAKILKDSGIEVTLAMTLSKININDIEPFVKNCKDFSDRFYFTRLVPVKEEDFKIQLSKKEWLHAMKRILKIENTQIPLRDPTFCGFFFSPRRAKETLAIAGCSIGYNNIAIESNGDIYPCRRLPIVIGNVYDNDLSQVWRALLLEQLRNRDNLTGKCGDCNYRWICGGCRGIAYAMHKDPLAEDPGCPMPFSKSKESLSFLPGNNKTITINTKNRLFF